MDNNILLIDKPAGWTSFDVVAKLRGAIRAQYQAKGIKPTKRQLRVGHAGTLDPFATGLLVILTGDGTKKAGEFLKLDKVYDATIRLGQTSTTGDPEGEITEVRNTENKIENKGDDHSQPTEDQVRAVLQNFQGEITQVPPKFSAIKVGGQRAYKLARKGQEVEIPSRTVTIHSIDLIDYRYPELRIRTRVSSGTYIRTLAEDIGIALETGAYCSQLRRTSIDKWSVTDAFGIDQIDALAKSLSDVVK